MGREQNYGCSSSAWKMKSTALRIQWSATLQIGAAVLHYLPCLTKGMKNHIQQKVVLSAQNHIAGACSSPTCLCTWTFVIHSFWESAFGLIFPLDQCWSISQCWRLKLWHGWNWPCIKIRLNFPKVWWQYPKLSAPCLVALNFKCSICCLTKLLRVI